jgi:ribosome biogenesis GTPase
VTTDVVEGVVVAASRRNVDVDTPCGQLRCSLRGRFRPGSGGRSPVVVGDRVEVRPLGAEEGVLERILPRVSELTRGTGEGPVVVAANLEQLLVVLAARDPPPRWALVDRMLVYGERDGLVTAVCLNKWDQVEGDPGESARLEEILALYRGLGFSVFRTAAARGEGLESLAAWLQGKATAVSGHSGVGKSTLLNALHPGLALATGAVNAATGKGRHTTSAVTLLRMPFGGYVADTPGFRSFSLAGMTRAELGRHFPEFRGLDPGCRYPDCLHAAEPDCAVRRAVAAGKVSKFRYENYLQILSRWEEER